MVFNIHFFFTVRFYHPYILQTGIICAFITHLPGGEGWGGSLKVQIMTADSINGF